VVCVQLTYKLQKYTVSADDSFVFSLKFVNEESLKYCCLDTIYKMGMHFGVGILH